MLNHGELLIANTGSVFTQCIIVTHGRTVKAEPAAACLTCSSPIHPPPVYPECIKQPEKAAGLAAGQLNSLLMQTQACFQRR